MPKTKRHRPNNLPTTLAIIAQKLKKQWNHKPPYTTTTLRHYQHYTLVYTHNQQAITYLWIDHQGLHIHKSPNETHTTHDPRNPNFNLDTLTQEIHNYLTTKTITPHQHVQ